MPSRRVPPMLTLVPTFLLGTLAFLSTAHPSDTTDEATRAAKAWLEIVDRADYAASWKEAARYFKDAVPEKTWVQQVGAVRGPLGKVVSRKLKSATYAESLPGVPDGRYVVIQFETSFEKKKTALETITPVQEKDGAWRVSGYLIK